MIRAARTAEYSESGTQNLSLQCGDDKDCRSDRETAGDRALERCRTYAYPVLGWFFSGHTGRERPTREICMPSEMLTRRMA